MKDYDCFIAGIGNPGLGHNGGKQDYVWSAGDPLGRLLVLPCPI